MTFNSTNFNKTSLNEIFTYFSFGALAIGVFFNMAAISLFSKSCASSSRVIFIVILLANICSLFTWNLGLYHKYFFEIYYEYSSIMLCRGILFVQYVSIQSSGWLFTLLCLDRLIYLISKPGSIYKCFPFGTISLAWLWSFTVFATIGGLNYQILIIPDSLSNQTTKNSSILAELDQDIYCNQFANGKKFIENWDIYLVYVYFYLPIACIALIDFILIIKYISSRKANKISFMPNLKSIKIRPKKNPTNLQNIQIKSKNSKPNPKNTAIKKLPNPLTQIKEQQAKLKLQSIKRRLSLTLNVVGASFFYIIMTMPFVFRESQKNELSQNDSIRTSFDLLAFSCNSSLFFVSAVTNLRFRENISKVFRKFRC